MQIIYGSGHVERYERELPHKWLVTEVFGDEFWDRVVGRLQATTIYERDQCERMLNEAIAYLIARSRLDDPNDVLVCNLLPDQAWHVFIHFTQEYMVFCEMIAGVYLHHDPAGEAALVNRTEATRRTVGVFERYGIEYCREYWQDDTRYPMGADVIRTGIIPR